MYKCRMLTTVTKKAGWRMKACCAGGMRACVWVWEDEGVGGYKCVDEIESMKVEDGALLCW